MPDSHSASFISPDHRPHTGRSRFYKFFLGLPTLLASNLRCFERASPLATSVFKSFQKNIWTFWFSATNKLDENAQQVPLSHVWAL